MKRSVDAQSWMPFTATQTISNQACEFAWRARTGPFGVISVCDALRDGEPRLAIKALGLIPLARAPRSDALVRGELMRYLAELAWAPDAILCNPSLRWREDGPDALMVGAGSGDRAAEVRLTLDTDGRIEGAFAPDRPRSPAPPVLPTPWRGRFWDYRRHGALWLPFAAEVAWEIDGKPTVYWQGQMLTWEAAAL
jgi:hypothetical protein